MSAIARQIAELFYAENLSDRESAELFCDDQKTATDTLGGFIDAGVSIAMDGIIRRVVEWQRSSPRQPAALAFTAGPERQIADLIEAVLKIHKHSSRMQPVIDATEIIDAAIASATAELRAELCKLADKWESQVSHYRDCIARLETGELMLPNKSYYSNAVACTTRHVAELRAALQPASPAMTSR